MRGYESDPGLVGPVIFRFHNNETVFESVKSAKIFNSLSDMKEYIADKGFMSPEDIVIEVESINDDRIGWEDCRYVCTKRFGNRIYAHPQCIGYCATKFPKEAKDD